MPRQTKEMLKLNAWLAKNETGGVRSSADRSLRTASSAARRERSAQKARAVERQLRWRAKARNRRKWNRYQRALMQRFRRLHARRIDRKRSPTNDPQPNR